MNVAGINKVIQEATGLAFVIEKAEGVYYLQVDLLATEQEQEKAWAVIDKMDQSCLHITNLSEPDKLIDYAVDMVDRAKRHKINEKKHEKYDKKRKIVVQLIRLTEPRATPALTDMETIKSNYSSATEGVLAAIREHAIKLKRGAGVDPVDAMAVWEFYIENSQMLDFLPDFGAVGRRQFVYDTITPLCDKWFSYANECGYDEPYDFEFVPKFLMLVHSKNLVSDSQIKSLVHDIAAGIV